MLVSKKYGFSDFFLQMLLVKKCLNYKDLPRLIAYLLNIELIIDFLAICVKVNNLA